MSADSSPPSDGEQPATKDEQLSTGSATAAATAAPSTDDSSATMDPQDVTVSIGEETAVEAKSVAMEIDAAFQADPSGFAMSFEELSAENQPEQLYDDLTAATEDTDNQTQEHELQASAGMQTLTQNTETTPVSSAPQEVGLVSIKQEQAPRATSVESKPTKEQPQTATRKSPRRTAEPKAPSTKKSGGGTKRGSAAATASQAFSWNDILRVQNLIERCLQRYLSKNDIVMSLKAQANVDPAFTAVVWQKLEEQNPTFFKAYNLQLKLKDQITAFNYLVSQQKEMMAKASGSAAFMSFLSSTESRNAQRQGLANNPRASRLAATSQARARSSASSQASNSGFSTTTSGSSMGFTTTGTSQGFGSPSSLPLPSPIKTDLDTHAFFS